MLPDAGVRDRFPRPAHRITSRWGDSLARSSAAVRSLSAFPFGSAGQLARAVRSGAVSSVELLRAYLDRVDRLNPAINAIVVDDRYAWAGSVPEAAFVDRVLTAVSA